MRVIKIVVRSGKSVQLVRIDGGEWTTEDLRKLKEIGFTAYIKEGETSAMIFPDGIQSKVGLYLNILGTETRPIGESGEITVVSCDDET